MILSILNQLEQESSSNKKIEILQSNIQLDNFARILYLAYSPKIKFWIKKRIPVDVAYGSKSLSEVLDNIHTNICSRQITGNAALDYMRSLLEELSKDDQEVVFRIIEKDLKCGISAKTINKVFKGLIEEYPVLLCDKFDNKTKKKIKWETAIINKKEDGGRCNLEFKDGKCISVTSRNGNELFLDTFNDIKLSDTSHFILDGELLYAPNGIVASRKIGNGYVTKAIRGTISPDDAKHLIFVCWDWIPFKDFDKGRCEIGYKDRFQKVLEYVDGIKIKLIENGPAISEEHAIEVYEWYLRNGFEGIIVKNADAIWTAKRSSEYLKMKAEETADLLCIGFEYGELGSKYESKLGALICRTYCGQLEVNVGTGFTDDDRANPEKYVDKIIEVKYNCVIDSKGKSTKSLFLPVYKGIRYDKDIANTLKELK